MQEPSHRREPTLRHYAEAAGRGRPMAVHEPQVALPFILMLGQVPSVYPVKMWHCFAKPEDSSLHACLPSTTSDLSMKVAM